MAGSSQPQHFFAARCIFADFAIAVIFRSESSFRTRSCEKKNNNDNNGMENFGIA